LKIRKMTASFGCLDGKSMELNDALNVIYAPNESGKSTWCAFIRAMLYGIDSSQRERAGVKPDKLRYAPWSGAPMAGEMEIEHLGAELTLSRSTKTASAPMREFKAVYTGTSQPFPALTGTGAGEAITGMSKQVFESSVFIGQSSLAVTGSAELEKRIGAIVSTGDEDSQAYSTADGQLRAWQRKRKYARGGRIAEVEEEIRQKSQALEALRSSAAQRQRLEAELDEARGRCLQLRELAGKQEEALKEQTRAQLAERRDRLREAERQRDEAREEALALEAELKAPPWSGKAPEQAERELEGDKITLIFLRARTHSIATGLLPAFIGLAFLIASAALELGLWFGICSAALALVSVPLSLSFYKRRKLADRFEESLIRKYGVASTAEIDGALCAYREKTERAKAARDRAEELERRADGCQAALDAMRDRLLKESGGGEYAGPLAEAEARAAGLRSDLDKLTGRFDALGDPMVLSTELAELSDCRDRLQSQYDALELAISTLRQANDEMQQRFSPLLSRRAGELMSQLTGGKYDRLTFDRSMNAVARPSGDATDRETAFLSAGTVDQLYLALRLAICELALPEGFDCPLVLDDALVNFDGPRMEKALDLLSELSNTRQIILFTCHRRELDYVNSKH